MARQQYVTSMFCLAGLLLAAACDNADSFSAPRTPVQPTTSLRRDTGTGSLVGPGPMLSGLADNVCADVWGAVTAPGTPVKAHSCHGGANQRFALQPSGAITAYDGALCLDVWQAKANDGDPVVIYPCHGGANQKWTRTAAGELRTAVNGKCLDLWGAKPANGTKLAVYSCHGGANQKWTVRDASSGEIIAPTPVAPVAPTDTTSLKTTATAASGPAGAAELPRTYLDTRMPTPTGRTINVAAGGDLQAALDAAQPGDVVTLAPGATFVGNFVLRAKSGMTASQWITVRSGGTLPAEGTRVGPGDASQMPKLLTPNNFAPALGTAPGAQGWRVTGLEISSASGTTRNYSFVNLGAVGSDQTSNAQVPSRIVLDRVYVHASPTFDLRRCVALNSASSAVIDSYLADCHSNNSDSQAILGWNGPGPYKIVNNHLEGGHEIVMFGGSDPSVPGLVPSDIEIRRNHVTRPLAWKGVWQVKNLLELKAGQRVLIEANVFENNWVSAQNGFAFVWWSLNADGGAPWSVTQDVTFRYNTVRNTPAGFNLNVGNNPTLPLRRVTITHNVVTGVNDGGGRAVQIGGSIGGLTIANNTLLGGAADVYFTTPDQPVPSLVYRDNVTGGQYTLFADGGLMGAGTLSHLQVPAANVTGNVIVGGSGSGVVPSGNSFASSAGAIGFVNLAGGDMTLSAGSPFRASGTGGTMPGADVAVVMNKTQGVAP